MKFEGEAIGDFIIVRSNGMPSYNFAVVIDDQLMGITTCHSWRRSSFQYSPAVDALQGFWVCAAHLRAPFFNFGKDRAKLGKRHGSVSVGEFRKQGILPEALINYLGAFGKFFHGWPGSIVP